MDLRVAWMLTSVGCTNRISSQTQTFIAVTLLNKVRDKIL